jgi:hypothetical protein
LVWRTSASSSKSKWTAFFFLPSILLRSIFRETFPMFRHFLHFARSRNRGAHAINYKFSLCIQKYTFILYGGF